MTVLKQEYNVKTTTTSRMNKIKWWDCNSEIVIENLKQGFIVSVSNGE